MESKPRVLVFIVAYNAEKTIQGVLQRIPASLAEYDTEILIIDDSSRDATFERAQAFNSEGASPFPLTVLFNPVNQGYGGNQKLGFHYAIRKGFDFVALVHGDGQYPPERLPELLVPLVKGQADLVMGSRMTKRFDALRGGMPLYKYAGNKILTAAQNLLLRSSLAEFHSGYRIYSVAALARIPFDLNANEFHFDTEIIIQFMRAGLRVEELAIPTHYGDEICHVNGMRYAADVIKTTLVSRAQDLGIFYERKYDLSPDASQKPRYEGKFGFESSHTCAIQLVKPGTRVLGVGGSATLIAEKLEATGCKVTAIDQGLDNPRLAVNPGDFDYILLLDVLEHLKSPEDFVDALRRQRTEGRDTTVVVTTANVAFFITRIMLFFGWFNYGARGILDLTHTRLFTFGTLRHLFAQAGYRIEKVQGIPAPFPLVAGNGSAGRFLVGMNRLLIQISKRLFSYQILMVVRPLPSVEWLLGQASDRQAIK